jgi:CHAT domain-containing protein
MQRGSCTAAMAQCAGLLLALLLATPSAAQDREALQICFDSLTGQGKYADAAGVGEDLFQRSQKQFGEDSAETASAADQLAGVYTMLGRLQAAETHYQRALAVRERLGGTDQGALIHSLLGLANLRIAQTRYEEAKQLSQRALAVAEQSLGPDHPTTARALTRVALMLGTLGEYPQGEALGRKAIAIFDAKDGVDSPGSAEPLFILGEILEVQNRPAEAEELFRHALRIRERALDAGDPDIVKTLNLLGASLHGQKRLSEAASILQRALTITSGYWEGHPRREETLTFLSAVLREQGRSDLAVSILRQLISSTRAAWGATHSRTAQAMQALGSLLTTQGKYQEATHYLLQALAIWEEGLGPDHDSTAQARLLLAHVLRDQQRYAEAEPLYRQALPVMEKVYGQGHPSVANLLNDMAQNLAQLDRYDEAFRYHQQARALLETALGANNPDVGKALAAFGTVLLNKGRLAEAEALYRTALGIVEKRVGEHAYGAVLLGNLGTLRFMARDWQEAQAFYKRAAAIYINRMTRAAQDDRRAAMRDEIELTRHAVWGQIDVAAERAKENQHLTPDLTAETFEAAQWAVRSQAASALSQLAARFAKDDGGLASLVRQRQDLSAAYQAAELKLIEAAAARPSPEGQAAEAALVVARSDAGARMKEIDRQLEREFPDYQELIGPKPLTLAEAQQLLHPNEVLVQFVFGAHQQLHGYVWAVTRTAVRWKLVEVSEPTLAATVQALRCGLDDMSWREHEKDCLRLLKIEEKPRRGGLPFDLALAHRLYDVLIGGVRDLVAGRHILVVPAGALASLPLSVLVTETPDLSPAEGFRRYERASWLGLRQPITVLPSVASLRAIRKMNKTGRASEAYVGFGNPTLDGHEECQPIIVPEACPANPRMRQPKAVASAEPKGMAPRLSRGNRTDVAALRSLCPLPDTKHELDCVATSLGASRSHVYAGPDATESAVKAAPLDRYRIVHFATHGLLASQTERFLPGIPEPAIVLSPTAVPSEEDDGLLTASEIAKLRLDADWVILSACNTAAAERRGADALSGLARAFFYAGARALVVSHWEVYSNAAAELTSRAANTLSENPAIGRAEAMRRSMAAVTRRGGFHAHPAFWSPFVVIGEGGSAARQDPKTDPRKVSRRNAGTTPAETWQSKVFNPR